MHLSPESLEAFVQAVSLGSFSAAARKLGKSQSTVSEAIARLEIDLGLELFDRSGRQPQLTEAGRTLLGRVEEVLGASDRLRRVAALLAGGSEPRVTLALSDTYHSARYEARLAELDERYPELEFECLIAEDQDVIAQVSRGRATLGLLAAQPHYPPELGVAAVAERAEFGLFAAVDHPLADLERVSERDLSEWRLLRLNTYSETGAAINDGLPSSGGRCWSAPNYLLLLEMATHGFGWAELPRWLVSGYANGRLKE
ncbi:TPA: LysR family transcriptional regulator, partial [Pseudomonas aeruginosa]|nr:LysR family transcriptional regulator [Pseudomonas aeruginosa]